MMLVDGNDMIICTLIVACTACFIGWLIIDYLDSKSRRELKIEQTRGGRDE